MGITFGVNYLTPGRPIGLDISAVAVPETKSKFEI